MLLIGFYHTVLADVEAVHTDLRSKCKTYLDRLRRTQHGVPSGLNIETVDKKNRILELKIKWEKQEFRILFYRSGNIIFIVNFFQKKTRKTPPGEIKIAIDRKKDIELDRAIIDYREIH